MTSGSVEVRGLRLAYDAWGPDDGPGALVLVHGLSSTRHIWDLVVPQLAKRHRVLTLDQRGHGESDQPDDGYDFPNIVADLAGLLEALRVQSPVLLVGHSWGASVVLHFAVEHPGRTAGIALVDGGLGSPGERMNWEDTLARLTPPDIDGLAWDSLRQRMWRVNGLSEDPRVVAVARSLFHVDADGRVARRLTIPNHLRILRALWEQRPAELLPEVRSPMLLLPARQASDAPEMQLSKRTNVERALEVQPRARARWFEDTIHDVPLQRPDELATELLGFADEVFATTRSLRPSA